MPSTGANPTRSIHKPLLLRPPCVLLRDILRLEYMHPTIQPTGRNPSFLRKFLALPFLFPLAQCFACIVL